MGLEARRNGRLYFYQKRRRGKQVVSIYVGAGEVARCIAHVANMDRNRKREQRRLDQAERERLATLHRNEAERERDVRRIMADVLVTLGYRNHRGEWRRPRNDK